MPATGSHVRLIPMGTPKRNVGRGIGQVLALAATIAACGGCSLSMPRLDRNRWLGDFDTAERNVAESDKELLILYITGRRGGESFMQAAKDSDSLAAVMKDKVRCVLARSFEPDRRYVAQYGVDRAPAVILVHRDGTYHARTGPVTPEDIETFLASAKAPGRAPAYDPHIPRRALYKWQDAVEPVLSQVLAERRPALIVYHRKMSRDWQGLTKLLRRHEVYSRLDKLIHCRIGLPGIWRETAITPFGALRLPALVIVRPDGQHAVLEVPASHESIVHFAQSALSPDAKQASNATSPGTTTATP